jgi:hypothetical protein
MKQTRRRTDERAEWMRPRVNVYKASERGFRVIRNRYFGRTTIGIAVNAGGSVISVRWKRMRNA